MTGRVMLVLKHGYSGTSGLGDVERRAVTAEHFDRRPFRIHRDAADCFSGDQPIEGNPGVVAGDTGGVCTCTDGDAQFEHFANWRGSFSGLFAITVDEVFTLISHAMLNGDSTAQCSDAFE